MAYHAYNQDGWAMAGLLLSGRGFGNSSGTARNDTTRDFVPPTKDLNFKRFQETMRNQMRVQNQQLRVADMMRLQSQMVDVTRHMIRSWDTITTTTIRVLIPRK
jgi:hypothetical protein